MKNSKIIGDYSSNFSDCLWSLSLKVCTIVFSVILIVVLIALFKEFLMGNATTGNIIAVAILVLLSGVSVFFSPKRISVQDDKVQIQLLGTNMDIFNETIDHIEKFLNRKGLWRTCGIGGFFGNVGYYKSSYLGNFVAYVTDWSKSYVIYRKDKKPIVVSVEDPAIFAHFMKNNPTQQ